MNEDRPSLSWERADILPESCQVRSLEACDWNDGSPIGGVLWTEGDETSPNVEATPQERNEGSTPHPLEEGGAGRNSMCKGASRLRECQ